MDLQAGSNIGGYVLDSYLGGGSFGAVWRGHDVKNGQLVAVKLLTGALSTNETAAMRADVELLAGSAASRSEHVVHVLGGGVEPVPHIVMEYVEGSDLSALLKEKGKLSAEETIDVAEAISDALAVLNEAGIIHRDIKPANVMVTNTGEIKLADFGIAKIVGYETVTMAGQTAMTMAYAAPEVWDEGSAFGRPSHKSDLYALGVLLFQCLTGEPPFRGNYGALYKAHTQRTPDTGVLPPETPPSLRNLIQLCLEKKQENRPNDAAECIQILERARIESTGSGAAVEPHQFGPWIKDAPHESQPWAWHCHHETSNAKATVEVHFADSLQYADLLHKALQANAKLVPLGAEQILETNRLMLRPTEAWQDPPTGRFQFWVAREDRQVEVATSVTAPRMVSAVFALSSLIDTAAEAGVAISLRGNTSLLASGDIYVRRPGLVEGAVDSSYEATELILNLPLDAEAARIVRAAGDFPSLVRTLAADSTVDRDLISACLDDEYGRSIQETVIVSRVPSPAPKVESLAPFTPVSRPAAATTPSIQMHLARSKAGAASAWYDLTLVNLGSRPAELRLDAADRTNALTYSLPRLVTLAVNDSEHIRVRVKSNRHGFLGGTRHTSFTITASGEGNGSEPPLTISGEFEDHPSMFAGAGVLGIAALAIAGGVFLMTDRKHTVSGNKALPLASANHVDLPELPVPVALAPTPIAPAPDPQPAEVPAPDPAPVNQAPVAEPVFVPPPAPAPELNRANCSLIRGTNYLSGTEASWYRANCSAPAVTVSVPAQKTSSLVGLSITGGNGSTHHVGEQLTLCYTSKANQRIRVYDTSTPGTLMRAGVDDGRGECFAVTVTPPTGSDSIRIDALSNNGNSITDYAQLSIIVVL